MAENTCCIFLLNSQAVSVPLSLNAIELSRHHVQPVGFKLAKCVLYHYENHIECRIIVHKFKG